MGLAVLAARAGLAVDLTVLAFVIDFREIGRLVLARAILWEFRVQRLRQSIASDGYIGHSGSP